MATLTSVNHVVPTVKTMNLDYIYNHSCNSTVCSMISMVFSKSLEGLNKLDGIIFEAKLNFW